MKKMIKMIMIMSMLLLLLLITKVRSYSSFQMKNKVSYNRLIALYDSSDLDKQISLLREELTNKMNENLKENDEIRLDFRQALTAYQQLYSSLEERVVLLLDKEEKRSHFENTLIESVNTLSTALDSSEKSKNAINIRLSKIEEQINDNSKINDSLNDYKNTNANDISKITNSLNDYKNTNANDISKITTSLNDYKNTNANDISIVKKTIDTLNAEISKYSLATASNTDVITNIINDINANTNSINNIIDKIDTNTNTINNNINIITSLKTELATTSDVNAAEVTKLRGAVDDSIKVLDTRITEVSDSSNNNIKQIKEFLSQEFEDTRWDIAKLQNIVIGPIAALNDRITTEISNIMDTITNTISNDVIELGYRVTNIESIIQGRLDILEENILGTVQKPLSQLDARVANIEKGVGNRLESIEKRQLLLSDESSASKKAADDRIESIEKGLKSRIIEVDQGLETRISVENIKVREEIMQASQKLEQIIESQRLSMKLRKALSLTLTFTGSVINNSQAKENRDIVKSSFSSGLEAISSIPKDLLNTIQQMKKDK